MVYVPEAIVYDENFIATEAISKDAVVVLNTSVAKGVKLPAAADARQIVGVALDDASASGDTVLVRRIGIGRVVAFASANIGDLIAIKNTVGQVYAPTFNSGWGTGDGIVGEYYEAPTASGDIVAAYINPSTVIR